MSKIYRIMATLGLATALFSTFVKADELPSAAPSEKSQETKSQEISSEDVLKISETLGYLIQKQLNMPGFKFDLDSIIKGMRNGVEGKSAPLTDKEYEEKIAIIQKIAMTQLAEQNLKAAEDFLAKNAKEAHVVEIEPNRLQYLVLKEGQGATVQAGDTPLINYTGKFIDGTVFGSSEELGNPVPLPLDQTIPGFSKGLQGMKEGEKRRLFIHPTLGYGTMGHLPPNSLLILEVEVVKANSPKVSEADEETELMPLALEDEENFDDLEDHDSDAEEEEENSTEHSSLKSEIKAPVQSTPNHPRTDQRHRG